MCSQWEDAGAGELASEWQANASPGGAPEKVGSEGTAGRRPRGSS